MKKILIAGGDMRNLYCGEKLKAAFNVTEINSDDDCRTDERFDVLVLPVPPLNERGMIPAPCSETELVPEKIKSLLKPDAVVFAGKADDALRSIFSGFKIYDYMDNEALSLKNAIPTAEGAVQIALEELPKTLNGSDILITGMGRIGTSLTEILKGFGADITIAVRNAKGAATARIHGVKSICTKNIQGGYDIVFNTVPDMIFDREMLCRFDKKTLFIDLASKPGGIDFAAAIELGMKVIWALGLPGKTAPITSGEIIAETITEILGETEEIPNG